MSESTPNKTLQRTGHAITALQTIRLLPREPAAERSVRRRCIPSYHPLRERALALMTIPVTCACGRSLRVKDEGAGRKVRCPACGLTVAVPRPDEDQDVEDEALSLLMVAPDRPACASQPAGAPPPDEGVPPPPWRPSAPAAPPSRRSTSPRRKRSKRRDESEGRGFSVAVHPSIITGLLMMLGAAVWFFLGLAAGRIFIYPPIMFVLGIGAIIRGFRGED